MPQQRSNRGGPAAALVLSLALLTAAGAPIDDDAVVVRGEGPAVVLLNGLLGGTARFAALTDSLVGRGYRVVAIDAYRLGVDAPDVSYHGLARAVARVLDREQVTNAVVVAHAHATGVALRLAAVAPGQVESLLLLDGGAPARTRSVGVERGVRAAALLTRVPGGESILAHALGSGMRKASGSPAWVTGEVVRAYLSPLVAERKRVDQLAQRLAEATEPEGVPAVLARVHAPVLILRGASAGAAGPSDADLAPLLARRDTELATLQGVGHFVHEEAPAAVVAAVRRAHAARIARR